LKKRILLALLLAVFARLAYPQYFESGQDPACSRWRKISTSHFIIIFPDSAARVARQVASSLEAGYDKSAYSLNANPRRISVILHPSGVFSNAFVAWAPRRMEFITTPPQDNYAQDWNDQLALHEYRHLVQLTAVNRGLTKGLSWFFGEQITAGVMGAFVPFWFIEGDATLNETLLSNAGRGRLPSFDVGLRAQLLEKGQYSYDKAVYGSYKDFVPDHYVLGYHLVTMARRDYGSAIWEKSLKKAGALPLMITPFNHEIRKISGLSKVRLYKQSLSKLDSLWRRGDTLTALPYARRVSGIQKHYTSFNHPVFLAGGCIAATKSGVDFTRRIVMIDSTGKEHKITETGTNSGLSLSIAKNLIVWVEAGYDPRWDNRTYSNLWRYDLTRNRKKKITSRSRIFAPSLSPDAQRLVCITNDLSNIHALEIREPVHAKILHQKKFDYGVQIMSSSWSKDGNCIVALIMRKEGKSLLIADTLLNHIKEISLEGIMDMNNPVMKGSRVFFSSGFSGIDQIYAYDTLSKKTIMITHARFGAYDPELSADGNFLIYADYDSKGHHLVQIDLSRTPGDTITGPVKASERIFQPLMAQETGKVVFPDSLPDYPIKKYRSFLHLFNPHSWGPISINAERQSVNPGFTLMSQNKLSTLIGTAGYEYRITKKEGDWFANLSYRQWYPILDFKISYGFRSDTIHSGGGVQEYSWAETSMRIGIRQPLNLSSGKWFRFLQLSVASTLYKIDRVSFYPDNLFKGYVRTLDYQVYWSSQTHASQKDILPRWAQSIVFDYRNSPLDGYNLGEITALRTAFYFPGIGKHHNFYCTAAVQQNTDSPFKYADIISWPRGYRNQYLDRFISLSANYTLPLLYPDLDCGSVFYLKRIWMNAFADYASGTWRSYHDKLFSTGLEVYGDVHFFRFLAPFELGGRFTMIPQTRQFIPEFLYSVNLSGIQ
jgi:hypothetical protein